MVRPSDDRSFDTVVGRAAAIYKDAIPFLAKDQHFLFVCGAATAKPGELPKLRERFLSLAPPDLPRGICLLAERAAADAARHKAPHYLDLANFERVLAQISDVIILFVESAGSIAEFGYFSAKKDLLKKLLVIRDREHENGESFINNALVSHVNSNSYFRPAMAIDSTNPESLFYSIINRINERIPGAVRMKPFVKSPFSRMNFHDQFVFVHFVSFLLQEMTYRNLVKALKILTEDKSVKFDDVLNALCATGLITRDDFDPSLLRYNNTYRPFLVFRDRSADLLRAEFAEYQERKASNAA